MDARANSHKSGPSKNASKAMNGNAAGISVAPPRKPSVKARKSFLTRTFNIVARLSLWYAIYTILFRCPATIDTCDETSPKICKSYFQAKQTLSPHLTPYYETYAAPYVDLARPYYQNIDQVVITPARTYAVKYGGPQLKKAQALGRTQWEKNVQPELVKYQVLAREKYDETVAPHIEKASVVVAPYYDIAKSNALQTYHEILLPSYEFVQPYALQGYDLASSFTTNTAVPSALWAWNKTYVFLDSTVWPHVRDVYAAKVEPQLLRIVDRLGRYKGTRPLNTAEKAEAIPTQAAKSAFTKPAISISTTTAPVEATHEPEPTLSPAEPAEPETPEASASGNTQEQPVQPTQDEVRERAAKEVADDLEMWQSKFTTAADQGALEIEERIEELAADMIEQEVRGTGRSLVQALDKTVQTELASLKKALLAVLEQHHDGTDSDQFNSDVAAAVRAAGLQIKSKAQEIRSWRQSYEEKVEVAVTNAAQDHVLILESTRDLALQKIGMKWAWMDGITYKHWKKYHELRDRFDEWVEDLKRLVVTHPGLTEAQTAGTEIEAEAMALASAAAQELGNLKQVASWKAIAGDYTDDFDATRMQLAAEAAQKAAAEAAEALQRAAEIVAEGIEEGIDSVVDHVEEKVGSVSKSIGEGISSVVSVSPSEQTETGSVSMSQAYAEDTETSALPPLESMASEPVESADNLASTYINAETSIAGNATSTIDPAEPLPTSAQGDGLEQIEESIVDSLEEPTASSPPTTTTVRSAMFGAAAQSVPSRQPILDDDVESVVSSVVSKVRTDVPHAITAAAQAAYTAALAHAANQYSHAMSAVSVQVSGQPKPAHEELYSSASSAYFGAIAAANSKLNEAMTAASRGIYGTPTTRWAPEMPTVPSVDWDKVQTLAQKNLEDSVHWAGEQYESAKVAIGLAEPTPSTAAERVEKLMDQAKHNYYAGLGVAHARYAEFLSAASVAVSSLTATPIPSNLQESASSIVSVAGESASSAASAASEAVVSVASSVSDTAADAGDAVADKWDWVVSKVSSEVYGAPTPTPWYENFYAAAGDYASHAGEYAASATSAAVNSISSVTSATGDYAGSASSAASSQYSVVSSLVSELIVGKEPTFTESVYSRLAGAYGAASATVNSAVSELTASVASATSTATEAFSSASDKAKEKADYSKDEL